MRNALSGRWELPAVLMLGAALRVAFFSGCILSDDLYYIARVLELANGEFSAPTTHWEARIGLVGPAALFVAASGFTTLSVVAWPMICSALSVLVAYLCGDRLFSRPVGLIAAVLLACYPMELIFASHIFACAPVALLSGAALTLLLISDQRDDARLALLAGIALGFAVVVHDVAVLTLVFVPAYLIWVQRPWSRLLWAAAGFAAACVVDPLTHWLVMDAPLARLAVLSRAHTVRGAAADVAHAGFNVGWLAKPWFRLITEQEWGLYALFAIPCVVLSLGRSRPQPERALALFIAAVFLWLTYGTVSPTRYAPLARLPRYLAPVAVPLTVVLALHLARLDRTKAIAMTALLCSSGLLGALLDGGRAKMVPFKNLHHHLVDSSADRIVVDRAVHLPLRLAGGGRAAYTIEVLERERLDPEARQRFDVPGDRAFAVYSAAGRASAREALGREPTAHFPEPPTLRGALLARPWFASLLALGRSDARMRALRRRDVSAVDLYQRQ